MNRFLQFFLIGQNFSSIFRPLAFFDLADENLVNVMQFPVKIQKAVKKMKWWNPKRAKEKDKSEEATLFVHWIFSKKQNAEQKKKLQKPMTKKEWN